MNFVWYLVMAAICFIVFSVSLIVCIKIKITSKVPEIKIKAPKEVKQLEDVENTKKFDKFERTNDRVFSQFPIVSTPAAVNTSDNAISTSKFDVEEFDLKLIMMKYNQKIEKFDKDKDSTNF